MNEDKVVIRRHFLGILVFVILVSVFVVAGIWMMNREDGFYRVIGILAIVFFGGGGALYLLLMSWRPIVTVTKQGFEVPHWLKKNFVEWSNVRKIEIVEQRVQGSTQRYIGIFAHDNRDIAGNGRISQVLNKGVTGWKEIPAILIQTNFSLRELDDILDVLLKHYEEYQASYIDFDTF